MLSDEDIPTIHASSSISHSPSNIKDTNQGPLTRSRAKKLQEQVNSFLTDYNFNTSKNVILPKYSILMLLRYAHKRMEDTVLQNGSVRKVARTDDQTNLLLGKSNVDRQPDLRKNFSFPEVMMVHEDVLKRLSSLFFSATNPTSFRCHNKEFCTY
jgi:hypothetical protein